MNITTEGPFFTRPYSSLRFRDNSLSYCLALSNFCLALSILFWYGPVFVQNSPFLAGTSLQGGISNSTAT